MRAVPPSRGRRGTPCSRHAGGPTPVAGNRAHASGAGQTRANAERPPPAAGAGAAAPGGEGGTRPAGPLPTCTAPSRPRAQPRLSPDPGPPGPAHPAPVGSGAPRPRPGQLLRGRPRPLRDHSRRRAAGQGPLGTILPAAPGAASGSAGPRRGPEASPAHATATQPPLRVRQPWFPGRKKRHRQRCLDLRHLASDGGAAGTGFLSRERRGPRPLVGPRGGLRASTRAVCVLTW